jgi:alanyl-tRNA synthetase
VRRTGEIGLARIISEGSVGSGLRRIEMVTGRGAEELVEEQAATLRGLARRLGVPPAQIGERIEALLAELKQRQQELEGARAQQARGRLNELLGQVRQDNGLPLLVARVEAADAQGLREMGDWLRDKLGSGVIVLGAASGGKPQLLVMVTPDLVKQGYHAGNLVKALAPIVGGGGGGRPDMAQAGGRDESKLDEALEQVGALVQQQGRK